MLDPHPTFQPHIVPISSSSTSSQHHQLIVPTKAASHRHSSANIPRVRDHEASAEPPARKAVMWDAYAHMHLQVRGRPYVGSRRQAILSAWDIIFGKKLAKGCNVSQLETLPPLRSIILPRSSSKQCCVSGYSINSSLASSGWQFRYFDWPKLRKIFQLSWNYYITFFHVCSTIIPWYFQSRSLSLMKRIVEKFKYPPITHLVERFLNQRCSPPIEFLFGYLFKLKVICSFLFGLKLRFKDDGKRTRLSSRALSNGYRQIPWTSTEEAICPGILGRYTYAHTLQSLSPAKAYNC